MKEIKPSKRAFIKVARLARQAVKTDGWMTPIDEYTEPDAVTDYGIFEEELKDSWEETVHFQVNYGRVIGEIADQQARRFKIEDDFEKRYYALFAPLKDEFWEVWAAHQNLPDFWKKNIKKAA